ncbi:MAG: hypothetical protein FWC41_00215 [Firmicutes bacterium]|nr:hypothetical protein [Bacillota bacterium]
MERTHLHEKLSSEIKGYKKRGERILDKIYAMDEEILDSFRHWFYTNEIEDIEVEGYTVHSLMDNNPSLNVVGAFLTLDWLLREPCKAKEMIHENRIRDSVVRRRMKNE